MYHIQHSQHGSVAPPGKPGSEVKPKLQAQSTMWGMQELSQSISLSQHWYFYLSLPLFSKINKDIFWKKTWNLTKKRCIQWKFFIRLRFWNQCKYRGNGKLKSSGCLHLNTTSTLEPSNSLSSPPPPVNLNVNFTVVYVLYTQFLHAFLWLEKIILFLLQAVQMHTNLLQITQLVLLRSTPKIAFLWLLCLYPSSNVYYIITL